MILPTWKKCVRHTIQFLIPILVIYPPNEQNHIQILYIGFEVEYGCVPEMWAVSEAARLRNRSRLPKWRVATKWGLLTQAGGLSRWALTPQPTAFHTLHTCHGISLHQWCCTLYHWASWSQTWFDYRLVKSNLAAIQRPLRYKWHFRGHFYSRQTRPLHRSSTISALRTVHTQCCVISLSYDEHMTPYGSNSAQSDCLQGKDEQDTPWLTLLFYSF